MSDWMNTQLVRQYQCERQQETEHNRLVTLANGANAGRPIYAPTLAMIGGWLIAWGSQLQAHYGTLSSNIAENLADCSADEKLVRAQS